MSTVKNIVAAIAIAAIVSSCATLKKNKSGNKSRLTTYEQPRKDSSKKTDTTRRLRPYKEVITSKAVTRRGLFTIHRLDDHYFFEIPDSVLEKDILVVNRIAKASSGLKSFLGYAGDQVGESEIKFCKGPNNKLFIRVISYINRSEDSSENGMYRTVQASNLQPIAASFDIKAINQDSSGSVIEVTDYLNSDNSLLYFTPQTKKALGLGAYQKDKSYISSIQPFPINVELQSVNTYLLNDETATYELNTSFVMLPREPMKPRYYDERVGYFGRRYIDYDSPKGVDIAAMITRWRMEPRDEDKEKYLKGELVEPKKPIIFYIDPETPKKWIPYLIQGVNDWQKAFEKAGFKNAIFALQAPTNDSAFSLLDARHNAIIYKASTIANASGPNVHDPRTGEILESHINWYHNVQQILHDWYMIQAGPNDSLARKMVFHDSLMGQLIRFVCCHEVGHTLGLAHNFGASSTVPIDSLRSKSYVDQNGFCPSIMDYARFNYVAQPEDNMTEKELFPRIGIYDKWAIEWGYRWLPAIKTRDEEKQYMNKWIISNLEKDKRLWFGPQPDGLTGGIVTDPRCQSEDLGDDAMKASYYGIKNLKYVMQNLQKWTNEPDEDFSSLREIQKEVYAQYERYIMHVANNVGNKYFTEKKQGQDGKVFAFIPKRIQKQAIKFLGEELFDPPTWLYDKQIFDLIGGSGDWYYIKPQKMVINWLVSWTNYQNMFFAKMQQPNDAYTFDEFLSDFEKEIWKELQISKPINFARRTLQKAYIERLMEYGVPISSEDLYFKLTSDYYPTFRKHMLGIITLINKALPQYKDETTLQHLIEMKNRLNQGLNYGRYPSYFLPAQSMNRQSLHSSKVTKENTIQMSLPVEYNGRVYSQIQGCWEDVDYSIKY